MEIEITKFYKTEIGAKVSIIGMDENRLHQFLATVEYIDTSFHIPRKVKFPVSYSPYGKSNRNFKGFDIISEWDNSDLPEFTKEETSFAGSVLEKEIKLRYSQEKKLEIKQIIEIILSERKSDFWKDALVFINNNC